MTAYKGNDTIRLNSEGADRSLTGIAAAWVNFNGIGTVAILDSENVSSITDDGVGLYTININNNMSASSYAYTMGFPPFSTTHGALTYTLKCSDSSGTPTLKSTSQMGTSLLQTTVAGNHDRNNLSTSIVGALA